MPHQTLLSYKILLSNIIFLMPIVQRRYRINPATNYMNLIWFWCCRLMGFCFYYLMKDLNSFSLLTPLWGVNIECVYAVLQFNLIYRKIMIYLNNIIKTILCCSSLFLFMFPSNVGRHMKRLNLKVEKIHIHLTYIV